MAPRRWMDALDESGAADKLVRWTRTFPHSKHTIITLVHVLGPLEISEAIGAKGQRLLL